MLIKTESLTKRYGDKTVVDHLNLEIEKGQLFAYIGTNGAGKSTTIRMLTGLLQPSSGTIVMDERLKIGIVFQNSILDDDLTVMDNIESRKSLYSNIDQNWINRLLDLIDIDIAMLHQEYGTLSGGQKRKVDIVRALLNKPGILFLDEPTTGLDIKSRQDIWEMLRSLQTQEGLTIFLTTHYLEEAENADMTYIIDHGRVLAKGSAKYLKEEYSSNRLVIETMKEGLFSDYCYKLDSVNRLVFDGLSIKDAMTLLGKYQADIDDFDWSKGNINDVFLTITGTAYEGE